jgi:hypothetical protein
MLTNATTRIFACHADESWRKEELIPSIKATG